MSMQEVIDLQLTGVSATFDPFPYELLAAPPSVDDDDDEYDEEDEDDDEDDEDGEYDDDLPRAPRVRRM